MPDFPELSEPDPVPGEPATLPDGRPSRVTRAADVGPASNGPLADLTRGDRSGESFRATVARSLEDLAAPVEAGRGVLLAVNRGLVFGRVADVGFGDANAMLRVAAVARHPETGEVQGAWLADGGGEHFAADGPLTDGWLAVGGWMLFTNRAPGG